MCLIVIVLKYFDGDVISSYFYSGVSYGSGGTVGYYRVDVDISNSGERPKFVNQAGTELAANSKEVVSNNAAIEVEPRSEGASFERAA